MSAAKKGHALMEKELLELEERFKAAVDYCYIGRNYYSGSLQPHYIEVIGQLDPFKDRLKLFASKWIDSETLPAALKRLLDLIHSYQFEKWTDHMPPNEIGNEEITEGVTAARVRIIELVRELMINWEGQRSKTQRPQDVLTRSNLERLEWSSSTAAFVHIFLTLSKQGYITMSRKGGKENEPNVTAFVRALQNAFVLKGKDEQEISAEKLRVRFSDGASRQLSQSKSVKIQIPSAGELVIPHRDELE